MPDQIQFWRAGEWTMVYLNGELETYGEHYHADEWLQGRCGVVVIEDQDSCSVPDGHSPLHLLAEAEANMELRQERKAEAARLRKQAETLRERARELEK